MMSGKEAAENKGDGQPGVLYLKPVGQVSEDAGNQCEDQEHDLVLLGQIGHGADPHMGADGAHRLGAVILLAHVTEKNPGEDHCQDGGNGSDPKYGFIHDGNYLW